MNFGAAIIHVKDVTAAVEFYCKAFNQEKIFIDETNVYGEVGFNGKKTVAFASHGLAKDNLDGQNSEHTISGKPGPFEISFLAKDVAGAYQHAIDNGATPFIEPREKPWGQTLAYVRDLDGMLVQIESPMEMP